MGSSAPIDLSRLLQATERPDREAAWEGLIAQHTRLLMAVARSFGSEHDDVMERYAHILGKLRENEFRRLKAYDATAGAMFSTWLTVTARRMCYDLHREKFGRHRKTHSDDRTTVLRAARKALGSLAGNEIDADTLANSDTQPDADIIHEHRDKRLREALNKLTPRERLLITLRFEDDLSASRIAGVMGLPSPFHVYRKLNAILGALKERLMSQGIEDSDG